MNSISGSRFKTLAHRRGNSATASTKTKPQESEAKQTPSPSRDNVKLTREKEGEPSSRLSSLLSGMEGWFSPTSESSKEEKGTSTAGPEASSKKPTGGVAGAFIRALESVDPAAREEIRERGERQKSSVSEALEQNQSVKFENSDGDSLDLSIEKTGTKNGASSYNMELDGHAVKLNLDKGFDQQKVLTNFVRNYSEVPEDLRDQLNEVNFYDQSIDEGQAYPRRGDGITLNFDQDDLIGDYLMPSKFREKFDGALTNY